MVKKTKRDIHKKFHDFERKVKELESLKKRLDSLNTKGFEKDAKKILPKLKKVSAIPEIKKDLKKLENKIAKKRKKKKTTSQFRRTIIKVSKEHRRIEKEIDKLESGLRDNDRLVDSLILNSLDLKKELKRSEKRPSKVVSKRLSAIKKQIAQRKKSVGRLAEKLSNTEKEVSLDKKELSKDFSKKLNLIRKRTNSIEKKLGKRLEQDIGILGDLIRDSKKKTYRSLHKKLSKQIGKAVSRQKKGLEKSKEKISDNEKVTDRIILDLLDLKKNFNKHRKDIDKQLLRDHKELISRLSKFKTSIKPVYVTKVNKIEKIGVSNKLKEKLSKEERITKYVIEELLDLRDLVKKNKNNIDKQLLKEHKDLLSQLSTFKPGKEIAKLEESDENLKRKVKEEEKITNQVILDILNLKKKINKTSVKPFRKLGRDVSRLIKLEKSSKKKPIVIEKEDKRTRKILKEYEKEISENNKINDYLILKFLDLKEDLKSNKDQLDKKLVQDIEILKHLIREYKNDINKELHKKLSKELENIKSNVRPGERIVERVVVNPKSSKINQKIEDNEKITNQIILDILELKENIKKTNIKPFKEVEKDFAKLIKLQKTNKEVKEPDYRKYDKILEKYNKEIKKNEKINSYLITKFLNLKENLKSNENKLDKKLFQDIDSLRHVINENKKDIHKQLHKQLLSELAKLKTNLKPRERVISIEKPVDSVLKQKLADNEKIINQTILELLTLKTRLDKSQTSINKQLSEEREKLLTEFRKLKLDLKSNGKVKSVESKVPYNNLDKKLIKNEKITNKLVLELLDLKEKLNNKEAKSNEKLKRQFLAQSIQLEKDIERYKKESYELLKKQLLEEITNSIRSIEEDKNHLNQRLLGELRHSKKKLADNEKISNNLIIEIFNLKDKLERGQKSLDKKFIAREINLNKKASEWKQEIYDELHKQLVGELMELDQKIDQSKSEANQRLLEELGRIDSRIKEEKQEISEALISKLLVMKKELEQNKGEMDKDLLGEHIKIGKKVSEYKKEIYHELHKQLVGELMDLHHRIDENKRQANQKLITELEKINKTIIAKDEEVSEELIAKLLQLKNKIELKKEDIKNNGKKEKGFFEKLFSRDPKPEKEEIKKEEKQDPIPPLPPEEPKFNEIKQEVEEESILPEPPKLDISKLNPEKKLRPLPPIEVKPMSPEPRMEMPSDESFEIETIKKPKKIKENPSTLFLELDKFNMIEDELFRTQESVKNIESNLKERVGTKQKIDDDIMKSLSDVESIRQDLSKINLQILNKVGE